MPAAAKAPAKIALGDLHNQLGFHLAQASVITNAAFEACVGRPMSLRKVEYSLLMLLHANASLSPKQLSKALALTSPNLTMLLDRLQERSWIRRETQPRRWQKSARETHCRGRALDETGGAVGSQNASALAKKLVRCGVCDALRAARQGLPRLTWATLQRGMHRHGQCARDWSNEHGCGVDQP